MFGRSTFGAQPNTFGFGSNTTSTFGQPNQLFGNNPSGFGSSTSGFGSSAQPMFGSTQPTSTPLFGSTNTSTFGQSNQPGFGSALFGNTAPPSNSGIFGSTNNSSFGQQSKPPGFGFPSSSSGGLFSQNSQQTPQNASMFQSTPSGGIFGTTNTFGSNTPQMGTVIKFVPVTGTDSVQKSGIVQSINTKHHCITCMKDYENKSLEELRWEDYQCNRKGSQQQSAFGAAQPFGITSTSSTIFGQPDNKSTFRSPRTDFGPQGFGMSTQTTTPNIFAKSSTGFGTTTTGSFAFGTNTSSSGLFGPNTGNKGFGTQPNQPLFGQPQQTGFGNVFGQTNNQNSGGLFGKPTTSTTGFNAAQTGFNFGTGQQNQSNLFQTPKPNTGFAIFGQSNTQAPAFGQQPQQQQQQPAFGGFGTTFAKPTQPTFGQSTQPAFGAQQGLLFANNLNKPLFSNTSGGSLFNNNSFQQNSSFQFPSQQQQPPPSANQSLDAQSQDLRSLVQITDPYGYNKHLEGLSPLKPTNAAYVTNPKDLQKLLESPPPMAVVSPMSKRLRVLPITAKKTNLFNEMLDKETSEINFNLRTSAKRLVLSKYNKTEEASRIKQNEELTHAEILEILDKHPKFDFPSMVPRLDFSPLQDNYSSEPSLGPRDSLTSLISINSNFNARSADLDTPVTPASPMINESTQTRDSTPRDLPDIEFIERPKIDTCGVVLTRPEYFTVPPLEKLIEHKQPDGKCLVKGFTIGRVGYGNVCFPDLMDVANLDLDDLVHFRYREVTIYPDDAKKPPLGQGLNRRAQVTLDRVYPKAKIDRRLITDSETLIAINFSDTLRDLCDKHGTKFLDYRPETGSWVFMVEHFSKYGFSDSDEEDTAVQVAERQQQLAKKEKEEQERKLKEQQRRIDELKLIKEKGLLREKMITEEGLLSSSEQRLVHRETQPMMDEDLLMEEDIGMENDSLCTMGASIENFDFDYDDVTSSEAIHHIQSRRGLYQSSGDMLYFMKSQMYEDEHYEPVHDDLETLTTGRLFKDIPTNPKRPDRRPIFRPIKSRPNIFQLLNKKGTIPESNSMYTSKNCIDMAVFKGRSFKVGWGRGMVLAAPMTLLTFSEGQLREPSKHASTSIGLVNASGIGEFDPFMDKLEHHLQVVLDTSDIEMQNHNIPLFKVRRGKTALLRHQLLTHETAKEYLGNTFVYYYQQIWDLCVAFWGPISRPDKRHDLFSTWLERAVELQVQEELSASGICFNKDQVFQKIFVYLTGHRITKAAQLASKEGLCNLSLLISQLNSSSTTKAIMQRQLDQWKLSSAFGYLAPVLQKIYMITTGQMLGGGMHKFPIEPINVCEDLDWKRCLALMLWYVAPSCEIIARALELYQTSFQECGFSARPSPPYSNRTDIFDVLYHLILLHCGKGKPLESILHPETHAQTSTDYRLSWLLLQTLQALDVGMIGDRAKITLATSFSQQLESMGLYKWAIFVLLFIDELQLRKNYIMGVLYRNIQPSEDERSIEDEIVTEFCVPAEWLHEVKAYRSDILCMHWEAYKHFTYTKAWTRSHEVAIKYVVPQLVVNEQFDMVGYVLRDIEPGCRSIENWSYEGGLLLMFVDVFEKFQEKRTFGKEEAMSLHSVLLKICTSVSLFPCKSALQTAALSAVSKHCTVFSRILINQIQPFHKGILNTTAVQLADLIMPPDYKLEDLYKEVGYFYEDEF